MDIWNHLTIWNTFFLFTISSVSQLCLTLLPHGLQHARLPCPSPTPICSNSCPSSPWCHPTISSSVVPFSSCLPSFPASVSFSMSQVFTSGAQSTGASASASVVPTKIQDWSPLGLTGLIPLQSKRLSRGVFSNTTVQKYQFFGTQLSLWSNSHIHTWLLEKPKLCWESNISAFYMLSKLAIAFLARSKYLNFMDAITICSDFGAQENKVCHCFHCFPIYLSWSDGTGCPIHYGIASFLKLYQ